VSDYEIGDGDKLKAVAQRIGLDVDGKGEKELAKEVARWQPWRILDGRGIFPASFSCPTSPKAGRPNSTTVMCCPRALTGPSSRCLPRPPSGDGQRPGQPDLRRHRRLLWRTTRGCILRRTSATLSLVRPSPPSPRPIWGSSILITSMWPPTVTTLHWSEMVVRAARELNDKAKALGPKGINVVGICCTGNELLGREGGLSGGQPSIPGAWRL